MPCNDPIFDFLAEPLSNKDQTIADATHWDLIRTENKAYDSLCTDHMCLLLRYQDLSDRYSSLVMKQRTAPRNVPGYAVQCDCKSNHNLDSRQPTPNPVPASPQMHPSSDAPCPSSTVALDGKLDNAVQQPTILERVVAAVAKATNVKHP
ncbi:hypothetical protein CPC08DRAFT_766131 [Agrocybe pediades]|nr:hypothetical protein CPC08DRAFT_766131 [Agrocybe pediades]